MTFESAMFMPEAMVIDISLHAHCPDGGHAGSEPACRGQPARPHPRAGNSIRWRPDNVPN